MVSGTTSAVVWSEPNISQIEASSSTIYAWYQEFFDFFLIFFLISKVLQTFFFVVIFFIFATFV
jgi:hypothetical protein